MNYLSAEGLSKRYGERLLFEGLSLGIAKGDKVALVAKNGSGKTSLLNMLAGKEPADSGDVVVRNDLNVAYLAQDPGFDPTLTVNDTLFVSDSPKVLAIKRYETAVQQGDSSAIQKAFDEVDRLGAWEYESNIKQILGRLRITDMTRLVGELSGGQKRRIALAKVLIEEPDLFILDEPTNHLDFDMIEWLQEYFAKPHVTLLMVTHDRYFLDAVCSVIYELEQEGLQKYKGNYSYYLEKKAELEANKAAELGKAKALFKKELEWMRRTPQARTTKSKARIDAFYDVKKVAKQRVDDSKLTLEVNAERLGAKTVELHHIGMAFGELNLFEDIHYKFVRGERVGIIGNNGTGKSTLIEIIVGNLAPKAGKVVHGETLRLGHYRQEGMVFKPNKRVIEVVTDIADNIPLKNGKTISAARMLERFLFPRSQHYAHVEKLSGGEKRRLYLLTVLMANPNFLILDEPTNDLDILTLNVLEDFLQDFPGCLLIVTHDRYFMDKLVDHVFVLEGEGKWRDFPGNYTQYRLAKPKLDREDVKPETPKSKKEKPKVEKEKRKLTFNEKREFQELEGEMEALESKKTELQEFLNSGVSDHEALSKAGRELEEVMELLDAKELRWLELSEFA